jgi:hypothetical protein
LTFENLGIEHMPKMKSIDEDLALARRRKQTKEKARVPLNGDASSDDG